VNVSALFKNSCYSSHGQDGCQPVGGAAGDRLPSLSKYVKRVTEVIRGSGLRYKTGAGFTDIEVDTYDQLAQLLAKIEAALAEMGAQRISYTIKIDRRMDKEVFIDEKIAKAEGI